MGGGGGIDPLEQADHLGSHLAGKNHDDRMGTVSTIKTGFLARIGSGDVQRLEWPRDFFSHLRTGLGGARGAELAQSVSSTGKANTSESSRFTST